MFWSWFPLFLHHACKHTFLLTYIFHNCRSICTFLGAFCNIQGRHILLLFDRFLWYAPCSTSLQTCSNLSGYTHIHLSSQTRVLSVKSAPIWICLSTLPNLGVSSFWPSSTMSRFELSVRAASPFCWRPCFGLCLSVLRHLFADGAFLSPSP